MADEETSLEVQVDYPDQSQGSPEESGAGDSAPVSDDGGSSEGEGFQLPEKFKSVEDLYASYQALESKLGAANTPEESPSPTAPAPTQDEVAPGIFTPEQQAQFRNEILGEGLTDESKEALAKVGITPEMAQDMVYGQQARTADAHVKWVEDQGGKEALAEAAQWGKENWSPEAQDHWQARLDQAAAARDYAGMQRQWDQLLTQFNADRDTYPQTRVRGSTPAPVQPFASQGEMLEWMNDPRYQRNDTNFHAEFKRRLAISPNF